MGKGFRQKADVYLRNLNTTASWQKAYQEVFEICERVYRNNEYLLRKYNITKKKQCQEYWDIYGLRVSRHRELRIRSGKMKQVSIYTLEFIALYWNISLSELMSRDYFDEQAIALTSGGITQEQVVKESYRLKSKAHRKGKAKPVAREEAG